jgi:hypothetical protein
VSAYEAEVLTCRGCHEPSEMRGLCPPCHAAAEELSELLEWWTTSRYHDAREHGEEIPLRVVEHYDSGVPWFAVTPAWQSLSEGDLSDLAAVYSAEDRELRDLGLWGARSVHCQRVARQALSEAACMAALGGARSTVEW